MFIADRTHSKPIVYVADAELDQLTNLADQATGPGSALLRQEVDRAIIVMPDEGPQVFVRLNSTVEYADLLSGRTRTVTVVLPQDADIDRDRISLITPVGAALFGLTPGESFAWTAEDGRPCLLIVISIVNRS
jgi:regulator of nucleoside diphosphate kinase